MKRLSRERPRMSLGEAREWVKAITQETARIREGLERAERKHLHDEAAREMGITEEDAEDLSHGPHSRLWGR